MNTVTGACDCHVHVVGPPERFPQVIARSYTAGVATLDSLRELAEPVGVTRFVIVQPSFYGADNSCLLETLDTLGDRGRGVAVLDPASATPSLLQEYARHGVCGVRVNFYSKNIPASGRPLDSVLKSWMDQLPNADWHVEVIAPLATLSRSASIISQSPVRIVLDHYGLPGEASPESAQGRCLLELAALPHVWIKLSGPYRVLDDPLATAPAADWLNALLRVAEDRCVWGSDWPHTPPQPQQQAGGKAIEYRRIEYKRVFGDFVSALPGSAVTERILRSNPVRLFGFPPK